MKVSMKKGNADRHFFAKNIEFCINTFLGHLSGFFESSFTNTKLMFFSWCLGADILFQDLAMLVTVALVRFKNMFSYSAVLLEHSKHIKQAQMFQKVFVIWAPLLAFLLSFFLIFIFLKRKNQESLFTGCYSLHQFEISCNPGILLFIFGDRIMFESSCSTSNWKLSLILASVASLDWLCPR